MQGISSMALGPEPDPPTVTSVGDMTLESPEQRRRRWRDEPFRVHMPVDVRSISLTLIAGAAVLAVLQMAQSVIIPFVVSGLLFYALDPMVDTLQRWKLPRALGAALALLVTLGGIGAGAAMPRSREEGNRLDKTAWGAPACQRGPSLRHLALSPPRST